MIFKAAALLLAALTFTPVVANLSFRNVTSNYTLTAVPQYYGNPPYIRFGEISGLLVNASTPLANVTGNIMLCKTSLPVEPKLINCTIGNPAAIIVLAIQNGRINPNVGRDMYQVSQPYNTIPETVRTSHIVVVSLQVWTQLVVGTMITVDGSTPNPWIDIFDGWFGVFHQTTNAILPLIIALACLVTVFYMYRENKLAFDLPMAVLSYVFLASAIRGFYCAIDPANLRRLIPNPDGFAVTNIVLWLLIAGTTTNALFWYEAVKSLGGMRVTTFLTHPATKSIMHGVNIVWFVFIIIVRILDAYPQYISPAAAGQYKYFIIISLIILIGLTASLWSYVACLLLPRQLKGGKISAQTRFNIAYITTVALLLWSIIACTIPALTSVWDVPGTGIWLQWWDYIAHSVIQGLQWYAMHNAKLGSLGSSARSSGRTASTTRKRTTSMEAHGSSLTDKSVSSII